jgi:hypothetical protein
MSMLVQPDNVVHYLAERRLLTLPSVVAGDFMVCEQSSRNYNLKVIRHKSPGFFIKQVRQRNPAYTLTLEREAKCYEMSSRHPRFGAMAALLPKCHHWDPASTILVLEMLPDAENLWEHHQRLGCFPREMAELQGDKLGSYHRQVELFFPALEELQLFDKKLPWILSIHETQPQYLSQMSQGNAQLLQILRDYPGLTNALDALKRSWAFRALIHGDVKWENLLLYREKPEDPLDIRIIDWEMADLGDECWDTGAIFQAYLSFWIFSLPLSPGVSLDQAAAASRFRGEDMQVALAAFWTRYAAARGFGRATSRRYLERCMACAAARMVQTAYEGIQQSPQITPQALCQLQMSMNILRDPAAAVSQMVGL